MTDADRRRDEAEALASMFGEDFFEMSSSEWVLRCSGASTQAELTIILPNDYPSCSPPDFVLDAPGQAGLRQVCQDLVRGFVPGEEFGSSLAQRFFDFCEGLEHISDPDQSVEASAGTTVIEASLGSAVVRLKPDIVCQIGPSLVSAGFQEYDVGVFVNGEVGVGAEIREDLHVSVDGLDAKEDLACWVTKQLNDDISSFGGRLLEWVEAQRTASEADCGSADGLVDQVHAPENTGITLTGNAAWKARLQAGETVQFRGGGNSLHPRIKSGECCKYAPVFQHEDIKEKDIVFCQIKGRFWGHMVKKKTFVGGRDEYEYTISNIHGWVNGTCTLENVFGKVIDHWK